MQHCASERRHQHHNRPARHRGGGLEEDKADGAASGAPIGAIAGGSIAATLTAALYIWLRKRTTSTATANKGGRRKARGPRRHQHITLGAWQHRRAAVACHDGGDDDSAPSSPPWPPSDAVSPVTQSQAFNLNTIDSTTECIQDRRLFRMRGLVMVSAAFHDVRLQSCQWMKASRKHCLIGHNKDATPPRPAGVPTSCEYSRHARRPVGCVSGSEARARRAARDLPVRPPRGRG